MQGRTMRRIEQDSPNVAIGDKRHHAGQNDEDEARECPLCGRSDVVRPDGLIGAHRVCDPTSLTIGLDR